MKTKICTGCGRKLPATTEYFHKKGGERIGLRPRCIDCHNQYYQDNKKRVSEKQRLYRRENKELIAARKADYHRRNREKISAYHRAYADKNAERIKEYQRVYARKRKESKREYDKRYREANRGKIMARQKRWILDNIEHARLKGRTAAARYNARKMGARGSHTSGDIRRIYSQQGGRCYYCNKRVGEAYHVDHVVPLSRGGSNDPSNLVVSCVHCNASKSNKLPHEWEGTNRLL